MNPRLEQRNSAASAVQRGDTRRGPAPREEVRQDWGGSRGGEAGSEVTLRELGKIGEFWSHLW